MKRILAWKVDRQQNKRAKNENARANGYKANALNLPMRHGPPPLAKMYIRCVN
jgi:hypothetical protein